MSDTGTFGATQNPHLSLRQGVTPCPSGQTHRKR